MANRAERRLDKNGQESMVKNILEVRELVEARLKKICPMVNEFRFPDIQIGQDFQFEIEYSSLCLLRANLDLIGIYDRIETTKVKEFHKTLDCIQNLWNELKNILDLTSQAREGYTMCEKDSKDIFNRTLKWYQDIYFIDWDVQMLCDNTQ